MTLPAGLSTVTVTGSAITDYAGNPVSGYIEVTPPGGLTYNGSAELVPANITVQVIAGSFSLVLPATDAPGLSTRFFTYKFREGWAGGRTFNVSLPAANANVDYASLVPSGAAPGILASPLSLSVGTVDTLAAGSSATASLTGNAPQYEINLGIPTGPQGPQGTPTEVNGKTGTSITLAAADVGADAAGAAASAQSNAEAYTDTKTLVVKKATGSINTWLTDPSPVPVLESQFVAEATTVRLTVRATGRGSGTAGGTIMLGVCNATVGRRPRPFTQAELTTPPAGVTYYYVGVVAPINETLDLTTSPQGYGLQTTVYRDIILTGLTVGATYYVDVTAAIVGGADTIAIWAEAHAYYDYSVCAVPTTSGTNKAYVGYSAAPGGVQVVNIKCTLPYTPMSNGALISTGPVVHLAATPDHTKVVAATSTPSVQVINTATDSVSATYAISPYANQVAISPDSATAWLLRSNNTVVPMTIATGALGTAITMTGNPAAGVVTPDGSKLWVCQDSGANIVRTFNTADGSSAGADIAVSTAPTAICITPDGSKVYVAGGGYVYEISTASRTVTRSISFAGNIGTACIALFAGDTPRTLLVWTNATAVYAIYQIDLIDWTVYTHWGCLSGGNAGFAFGCLTSTGDILAADFTNAQLDHWLGGAVAFDTSTSNTFLHEGEGVEIACTPAT